MDKKLTQKKILIAGPCSIESEVQALTLAHEVSVLADKYNFDYVFKGSFDKANRTSVHSKRGVGLEKAIKIFEKLKTHIGCKVTTDVHETWQIDKLEDVVDVIQIPAFLCRQTDLLLEAGHTMNTVNIKKGQFVEGKNMVHAVNKVLSTGNKNIWLTERGSMFGMGDLVVDFRQVVDMKELGYPVIMDCTHSTQRPNSGDTTAGQPKYAIHIAKLAKAVDIDGWFFEVHENPSAAWSDGSNMIQLKHFENTLKKLI
jgi:2-dehydro-3-deoxyphosphooctonate aldolase (KDO 8-P synthase)